MPTPIERFMTKNPVCIDAAQPMAEVFNRMVRLGCRHLPMVSAGMLVGVISLRGLYRLEKRDSLARANRAAFDAVEEPLVVVPGTPVAEVAGRMAAGGFEAAIVVDRGQVAGIFTEADAVRALAELADGQSHARASAA